jgi:hypothetical protein
MEARMRVLILGLVVHVLLSGVFGASASGDPGAAPGDEAGASNSWHRSRPAAADTNIKKASICFRIGVPQWVADDRFEDLVNLFDKYKGVTDEITFFHSETHSPVQLAVARRRARILKKRIAAARRAGYGAGINILTTMGHHEEALSSSIGTENFTPVTDIDGNVSRGSFCPNDTRLRDYIRQLWTCMADAEPDYMWIDDDVRFLVHWPVRGTCFCDNCLKLFSEETGFTKKAGKTYTRELLKQAFASDSLEKRITLRKAWVQHIRDTISRLFELIEKTVHKDHPNIELGFMTGGHFYDGLDYTRWARILAGPNNVPVRWRPGGGFYSDKNPGEMIDKSHGIGRQVSLLPPQVTIIQSEIENFPYYRLRKSVRITALESASHIAAGCTGMAFNVLSMSAEPFDEYEPLVARLHHTRKFYNRLAQELGRQPIAGIWPAWNLDSSVTCGDARDSWSAHSQFLDTLAPQMMSLGLPMAYSGKHAPVILLGSDNASAFSDDEVREMLSKGVYMDADAAAILHERGFGDLIGFQLGPAFPIDVFSEQFTDHPLNGPFAGRQRGCRQSFWRWPAQVLESNDEKAQSLSRILDDQHNEIAPCTTGVYENRLGGRVCISGYFPWDFLEGLPKTTQMKNVMRWLSKDRLPGYIDSLHKINIWIRQPVKGRVALALINSSFDPAKDVRLILLTDRDTIRVYGMDGKPTSIQSNGTDGPYRSFVVPEVEDWAIRLVVTE